MKRRYARSTDSTIKINIYKINTAGIDFFFLNGKPKLHIECH